MSTSLSQQAFHRCPVGTKIGVTRNRRVCHVIQYLVHSVVLYAPESRQFCSFPTFTSPVCFLFFLTLNMLCYAHNIIEYSLFLLVLGDQQICLSI